MAAKYQVKKAINGQFFFNLVAANGEKVLTSAMYLTMQGASSGIMSVRASALYTQRYQRFRSPYGAHYFHLMADNGEILGKSETYSTRQAMDEGILAVINSGPGAPIEDVSEHQEDHNIPKR